MLITCCVLAALALLPAQAIRGVLATAAASLFEGAPFILAGVLLQTLAERSLSGKLRARGRLAAAARALLSRVPAYLGCGCAAGPGALSLPTGVATGLVFGPIPALLRFGAALLAARLLHAGRRERAPRHPERARRYAPHGVHLSSRTRTHERASDAEGGATKRCLPEEPLLSQLAALLPAAILAGVVMHVFADVRLDRASPPLQWLGGAIFGFAASPCALGVAAIAASFHARAPFAAAGMLCVGGIFDARTLLRAHHHKDGHDVLAYAPLAIALACAVLAVVHRRSQSPPARIPSAVMLAGALLIAPPPAYHATETTRANLFPGERITFAGTLVHGIGADALVRFAITCCRADASPVALRLASRVRYPAGAWLWADGIVERSRSALAFRVDRLERIEPPADPFIYR